ncbi:polymorphic toxin-type HINT domain-containing protein [Allorhizocola rhizosphaerae]|uniref:polymorphic toxin-type HINT domain-containing protein n=1 Tax=Allorhizocola rhizosphaerae TaxID=1872709 RepID=UPI000E3E7052|nr:polymorphic toxin-type HINT domain-containing protein [Allorhizocola rhizosphaerae]
MSPRKWVWSVTVVAIVSLLSTSAHALPATAAPYKPPKAQEEPKIFGQSVRPERVEPESTGRPFQAADPVWPVRSTVDVVLPSARERRLGGAAAVAAGDLPVTVESSALAQARVHAFGRDEARAAGVDGVLLRVSRADEVAAAGPVRVSVGYAGFRHAYGGDWAHRLRLMLLPECALTTPTAPACQPTPLDSVNDARSATVTATVGVTGASTKASPVHGPTAADEPVLNRTEGGALVALAAAPAGSTGDYKATSLSPSATWNAGGNTGDFSWSYDLRVPPAVNGPAPSIALGYSSSSVDGRMASANNQPSWIGEGFEWHPGYVERRYNTCSEDMGNGANNTTKTGDQCWDTDNATISFSGHAGELIKGAGNRWHLREDDGTKVERRTGGPNTGGSNPDNDGEWWVATTPDGTQWWFGGRAGSNATLVSTVFGNHSGEPCHQSSFAASHCNQAYRWQLDHVVDVHGNTMSLTYVKETNKYGRNNKVEDDTVYDRDGYLQKIEYGTRTGSAGPAPMQVLFTVADRCLANCADKKNWPDVPLDEECTAVTCALTQTAPSFWTKKRLVGVKTQVWGGSAYRDVEEWAFTHTFPDPTDSITPALWLEKITHVGSPDGDVGPRTTIPDITFTGQYLPNRVDTAGDQYPAMNRFRIRTITSEAGGKLDVTYSAKDCVPGSRMPNQSALQDNGLRCYPVRWIPPGHTNPINDFFHKYVVTDVVEADIFGASSRALTHYDYVGAAAWHYTDEDGMIKKEYKTWSVWRGYGAVRTVKGDGTDGPQTVEERRYFRGMHGDKLPSGTRNVQLPAIAIGNIPAVNDEDAFAGQVRETITYNGANEVSATVVEPWQSAPTATRTLDGATVHARFVNSSATHTRTALDRGRPHRTTSTAVLQFDAYGMAVKTEDRGEPVAGDEKCTLTDYVRNTAAWLTDETARVRVFAVDCARALAGGLTDDDVISDTKTSYDQAAWTSGDTTTVPSRGLVSKTETLKAYNGGAPTYHVSSRATHDIHGRVLESWDVRGAKTTTTYTPATGGPVTGTSEVNHLNWTPKLTALEPAFGLPKSTTDVNGRKVEFGYDGLGRLTQVWLPNRARTATPSIVYEYLIRNNAHTVVISKRLNPAGDYIVSYKLHDSLLRLRQTQEPDERGAGSAVITDTFYDSAGRSFKTHDEYVAYNSSGRPVAPSVDIFQPTGTIPSFKVVEFDGAGRETAVIHKVDGPPASPGGTEKWRTTTRYGGDRTDVTPPAGGTATSTIIDADDKTVERRDYRTGFTAGSDTGYDKTVFEYNRKDEMTKIVDAANNVWQYKYDLQGKQIENIDPDKGTTLTRHNDAGDIEATRDGNGDWISYRYDALGRKRSSHDGADGTGPVRAEWVYDTLSNGTAVYGELVKTIRHDAGGQYIKEHTGYTLDYHPTGTKYTIADPDLGGSYSYTYTYHADGSSATTRLPAFGDLPMEQLTHGYNAWGKASTLSTSLDASTYVADLIDGTPGTQYTSFGEVSAVHLRNNDGELVDITHSYETDTRRLRQIWTSRQTAPTDVADQRFEYDASGNVVKISDLVAGDHQCFRTDHLRQLKDAWTPSNGDCRPDPTAGALGGPSKYWHSFSYDAAGSRTELVEHATPTGDKKTTYTIAAGKHQLVAANTAVYKYDDAGNMIERPAPGGGVQTMTWDAEGRLATSVDSTGTTSYIYDADGNRLIRKDPTGKTLYLPGQELRFTTAGATKVGVRYYTHGDLTIAMRTAADGVVWLVGDHHGTAQISVKAVGQATSIRRETPFGALRQTVGTWPSAMDKGFVGGTNDNTGLTHLGAREYDSLIGRFISVDPVIDIKDPQQMNGYNYANNAPVTASDPDGLWPKWLDKAVNKVTSVVKKVASTVKKAAKSVGKWVHDKAGTISTVLGVAAMACSVIPPLQIAAPFLGAASTAVGAIETYKSCKGGKGGDCAMGIADMVPGGRAIGAAVKGVKHADEAVGAAKGAGKRGDTPSTSKANCHSFDPATPVLMADGGHKAIREVELGDKVVATDPETGETGPYEVVDLHQNLDQELTELTVTVDPDPAVDGDETTDTISTTANHPFWDETAGAWVHAGDLKVGHRLRDTDGKTVVVTKVDNTIGLKWMNDLTVAGPHTYYIVAAETPVLVHNNKAGACPVPGHDGKTARPLKDRDGDCTCPVKLPPRGGRNKLADEANEQAESINRRKKISEAPVRAGGNITKGLQAGTGAGFVAAIELTLGLAGVAFVRLAKWLRYKWTNRKPPTGWKYKRYKFH